MTSRFCSIAALFLLCFGTQTSSAEEIDGSQFANGNWSGAGYTHEYTGAFFDCVVRTTFASGDTLLLSVTDGGTVVIGISNTSFRFKSGLTFPGAVEIDRRESFAARITTCEGDFIKLEIERFEEAVKAIQRGLVMHIASHRFLGEYSLKGTMRALDGTIQCAVKNRNNVAKRPSTNQTQTAQRDDSGLYRFTTEVITTLGARDFRYLSDAEMQDLALTDGVYWVSQELGVVGGVLTTFAPYGSLRASFCSGDLRRPLATSPRAELSSERPAAFALKGRTERRSQPSRPAGAET